MTITTMDFKDTDIASERFVVPMLEDCFGQPEGEQETRAWEATRRYCSVLIRESTDDDGCVTTTMGELEAEMQQFKRGYEQALVDLGLMQADGRNTFPPGATEARR